MPNLCIILTKMNKSMLVLVLGLLACTEAIQLAHKGASPAYYFDESIKGHRCSNDNECDYTRTCSAYGWCQGAVRPSKIYEDYYYDERKTGSRCPNSTTDANYKMRNYLCDGSRVCSSSGWCIGTARLGQAFAYMDYYDERITNSQCPSGENMMGNYENKDLYCDGARTCNGWGWCQGTAQPPKNKDYKYDESRTGIRCPYDNDIYVPIKDYWCDGLRTCSAWGWCQGTAR